MIWSSEPSCLRCEQQLERNARILVVVRSLIRTLHVLTHDPVVSWSQCPDPICQDVQRLVQLAPSPSMSPTMKLPRISGSPGGPSITGWPKG